MERCLIIVSREWPDLWRNLTQQYSQAEGVEIIFDRRQGQQWTQREEGGDRRSASSIDTDLQNRGFVVIPRP